MRTTIATVLLIILIPCVLAGGLYAWAYYSLPALVTEAHNRELSRSAPTIELSAVPAAQQAQIRGARPLEEATAEALFYFPEGYHGNAVRKLQRSIFAAAVNKRLTPDEQLQLYVNHANFGAMHTGITPDKPIYGFPAASLAYFEKPLPRLDPEQLQGLLDALQHKSLQSNP